MSATPRSGSSRGLAAAVVVGITATAGLMYVSNRKTKAVDANASIYEGTPGGASTPLASAAGHTSDVRMNSHDVREHVSGGGKPAPKP